MASSLKIYQTWQAKEELYFWHIEAKLVGFSGTTAIQRRKQMEAVNSLVRLVFLFCSVNLLWFLNLRTP